MMLTLAMVAMCGAACVAAADNDVTIDIKGLGKVKGSNVNGVGQFLGIPFGKDMDGANRFLPPRPVDPWTDTFDATKVPVGCISNHHNPDVANVTSENCANLNIYAPLDSNGKVKSNLPVLVFYYGGSFEEGDDMGAYGLYNGDRYAAEHDIIVVAPNYRLGAFGFAVITDESTGESILGNAGFLDQQLALNFTNDHISDFGGDPSKITISGESAGAMSVGLHLIAPGSRGKFRGAIMDSNPAGYFYKTVDEAADFGTSFCSDAGCGDSSCNLDCMRKANVTNLVKAWEKTEDDVWDIVRADWGHLMSAILAFTPTVGTDVLPMGPEDAWKNGDFADVPLMVGTNTNEGSTFIYDALSSSLAGWEYDLALDVLFGTSLSGDIRAIPRYNDNGSDARDALSYLVTDYWFRCGSNRFLQTVASDKTFAYRYNHILNFQPLLVDKFGLPSVCETRVCHAMDLPVVFGKEIPWMNATFTSDEVSMVDGMMSYWANFVKTGDPNKAEAGSKTSSNPTFPTYSNSTRQHLVIQAPIQHSFTESYGEYCSFWDSTGYVH